jgi:hypothetical protein
MRETAYAIEGGTLREEESTLFGYGRLGGHADPRAHRHGAGNDCGEAES